MQIVGKHYCKETSFQIRFGRSKISLDIPEDGKVTKEGWRITPSTHPTVSITLNIAYINPLATNDAFWRCQILAACYQLVQPVLKIGSALAERVRQE